MGFIKHIKKRKGGEFITISKTTIGFSAKFAKKYLVGKHSVEYLIDIEKNMLGMKFYEEKAPDRFSIYTYTKTSSRIASASSFVRKFKPTPGNHTEIVFDKKLDMFITNLL